MERSRKRRRVVVTGLGVISSIGIGWEAFWKNLLAGRSGISKITTFDTSKYNRHLAGEVKDFRPEDFMPKRRAARMGRASQMAIAASRLALRDAGLRSSAINGERMGVCVGTTMGEPQVMERLDEKCVPSGRYQVDPLSAYTYPAGSISANIAMHFGLKGHNTVFANACAAGNYAIGRAFDLIRNGEADMMLAGGADAFSRIAYTGFARMFTIAPEKCQPFDKNRKGMIPAEGAGMLCIESLESARERKAAVYAEIIGFGLSCDARHMTHPSLDGVGKAIRRSLRDAGVKTDAVDYISAHGTGTKENDKTECDALRRVFDGNLKGIPVSSIKSMLGHTMGAASALEAIVCCLAIKEHKIPPTINLEEQDPECDIDCVPNKARSHEVRVALNNSLAFGGNNGAVIFTA